MRLRDQCAAGPGGCVAGVRRKRAVAATRRRQPPCFTPGVTCVPDAILGSASRRLPLRGRSNGGKSSTVSCLWGRRKPAWGRPRAEAGERLFRNQEGDGLRRSGGVRVRAGLEKRPCPSGSARRRLSSLERELVGVVIVVDARREIMEEEERLLDHVVQPGRPAILLASEGDRLSARRRERSARSLAAGGGLLFFSRTAAGRAEAWERIARRVEAGAALEGKPCQQ